MPQHAYACPPHPPHLPSAARDASDRWIRAKTVFTTSLSLIFRRVPYLVIFIGLFGLLGFLMVTDPSPVGPDQTGFSPASHPVAVIDRDQSALSRELTDFLGQRAELVELADSPRALQDAAALNTVTYLAIIPAGYGQDFLQAVRTGAEPPLVETVVSYEVGVGVQLDNATSGFLNAVRLTALGQPELSQPELAAQARRLAETTTPWEVVQSDQAISSGDSLPFFLKWSAFPMLQGLVVLVGLAFADFHSGEVRRRNLASPVRPVWLNLQVTAACLSLVGLTWAYLSLLSLTPNVGGWALLTTDPARAGLLGLALLVMAAVPLAIGFLLSQFHLKENIVTACAIIISLTFMFLSGVFMGGTDTLSPPLQAVARLTPVYWHNETIDAAVEATDWSWGAWAPYATGLAIVLLFGLALFSVGLVVARLNVRTATAGGNTAAEDD